MNFKKIKTLEEQDKSTYFCLSVGYRELIDSFGREVLLAVDDIDYQGDSRYILKDNTGYNTLYGLLIFGWGSCSGCDSLQACENKAEVYALRDGLWSSIKWMKPIELLKYIESHDWEGDFSWHAEEMIEFLNKAIKLLSDITGNHSKKVFSKRGEPVYRKVSSGYVVQEYNAFGKCVRQEFVTSGECEWENMPAEETIDEPNNAVYHPYHMEQPGK